MKHDAEAVVGAFVDAFNAENLEALVALLSESVEVHGGRGVVRGRVAARDWATRRPTGELHQELVLDDVIVDGDRAVALARRQWVWAESGEVADEEELGIAVTLDEDGLIGRWQPFGNRAEALAAAGLRQSHAGE